MDFKRKQHALIRCLKQFPRLEEKVLPLTRQRWYTNIVRYIKENAFDEGATSYMIDSCRLEIEVTTNEDKARGILKLVEDIMKEFHSYATIDIREHPFYLSLISDDGIPQEEFDWLARTYDGILYRFRANARLMEKFLHIPKDSNDQAREIYGIEPYEVSFGKIDEEYNMQPPVKTTLQQTKEAEPAEDLTQRFPRMVSEQKLIDTYTFLVSKELIKGSTKKEHFVYWFGISDTKPKDIQPIVWTGTKQNLREVLTLLYGKMLKMSLIETLASSCFSYKGEPMILAKNKEENSLQSDAIKKFFST